MLAITPKSTSKCNLSRPSAACSRASDRGFTLFELLIAMVIFMAIIGVILVVGTRVLASNRERSTQGVIRAVELVFEDWQTQTQQKYPEAITFFGSDRLPATTPPQTGPARLLSAYGQQTTYSPSFIAPIVDARWADRTTASWPTATTIVGTTAPVQAASRFEVSGKEPGKPGDAPQPSLTLMLLAISEVVPLEQMLSGIDPKLVKRESVPAFGWDVTLGNNSASITPGARLVEGPVIRDAFGFPLRFVTPLAHGGYGRFMKPSTNADVDWVATSDGDTATPPALPFNLRWFNPYSADVTPTGTATIPVSRRGRPDGMATTTSKTQMGDADEGLCRNGRPYIYSVGPDGDPRTQGDNVYSEFPDFSTDPRTPRNPSN